MFNAEAKNRTFGSAWTLAPDFDSENKVSSQLFFFTYFFRLHCFLSCMFLPLINYFYCLMINSNSRKLNLLIFCFMYIRLQILCFADSIDDGSSP